MRHSNNGLVVCLYEYQPATRNCPRCSIECFLPDYGTVVCGACGWRPGDPDDEYRDRRRRGSVFSMDRVIDQDVLVMRGIDSHWPNRLDRYLREVNEPPPERGQTSPVKKTLAGELPPGLLNPYPFRRLNVDASWFSADELLKGMAKYENRIRPV